MTKDKRISGVVYSSLTLKGLERITETYHIADSVHPTLPNPGQAIQNPLEKKAGVYHHHLKAGLRFPLNDFIASLLTHFHVHPVQLAPNGFRKVMCFLILCKMLDIAPTVDLFRYFYVISPSGDWLSFSKRPSSVELCLGLPSSIKNWKAEYFFVDSSAYGDSVQLGNLSTRVSDRFRKLTAEEQLLVDRLSENVVWWSDPDETTLGLAGLSPYWDSLDPKPSLSRDKKGSTLSSRLTFFRDMKSNEVVGISSEAGDASSSSLDSTSQPLPPSEGSMKAPKRENVVPPRLAKSSQRKRPLVTSALKEGRADYPSSKMTTVVEGEDEEQSSAKRSRGMTPPMDVPEPTLTSDSPGHSLVDCNVVSDPLMTSPATSLPIVVTFAPALLNFPPATSGVGQMSGVGTIPIVNEGGASSAIDDEGATVMTKIPAITSPIALSAFHQSLFVSGPGSFVLPPIAVSTPSTVVSTVPLLKLTYLQAFQIWERAAGLPREPISCTFGLTAFNAGEGLGPRTRVLYLAPGNPAKRSLEEIGDPRHIKEQLYSINS
ncbi:hypothetical protein LXL04_012778 [Taraxacum kok-saghyz]